MCVICERCTMNTLKSEQSSWHQLISETPLCTVDEMQCLNIMADDTHTYHKL
jgi:hypothetical protein